MQTSGENNCSEDKPRKIELLRAAYKEAIGQQLVRFETAEIKHQGEDWDNWFDCPIRFLFDLGAAASLQWSHFERLFAANDLTLPFPIDMGDFAEVRWKTNDIPEVVPALNKHLSSVHFWTG